VDFHVKRSGIFGGKFELSPKREKAELRKKRDQSRYGSRFI